MQVQDKFYGNLQLRYTFIFQKHYLNIYSLMGHVSWNSQCGPSDNAGVQEMQIISIIVSTFSMVSTFFIFISK